MASPTRTFAAAGLAALLASFFATPTRADLYGVTFLGNELVNIDPTTGVGNSVGPIGSTNSFGLAAVNNQLYTFDSSVDKIRQIDPATGAATSTTDIGLQPGALVGQGGLAFQSSTVGFLTSALNPTTLAPENDLYRFDLSTGTTTLVAKTTDTIEALAFRSDGTLFGLAKSLGGPADGNLFTIDPTTGAETLVGNVGIPVGSPIGALAFDPNGQLFATLDDKLYTLSTTTGAATAIGNSDPTVSDVGFSSISGLAFVTAAPVAVPEPSSVVMVGTGVVALGLVSWKRAKPASPVAG